MLTAMATSALLMSMLPVEPDVVNPTVAERNSSSSMSNKSRNNNFSTEEQMRGMLERLVTLLAETLDRSLFMAPELDRA